MSYHSNFKMRGVQFGLLFLIRCTTDHRQNVAARPIPFSKDLLLLENPVMQAAATFQRVYAKYRTPLAGLIAGFLALALMPHSPYHDPGLGLDASWAIGLHNAVKNKLVFGTDFVFTYGPLGVLQTRLSIGVHELVYILFDLFIVANFFYVFFRIITRTNLALSSILIYLCLWFAVSDASLSLLWLALFLVFEYHKTRKAIILMDIVAIAVLSFFIKLSTAFIPPVLAIPVIVYGIRAKTMTYRTAAIVAVSYVGLICGGAYLLRVDLVSYVSNGLHIINGYNDAMYVLKSKSGANPALEWALLYLLIFAATGVYFFRIILKSELLILLFVCSSLFLFALFRISFTRFHSESFFPWAVPVYGLVFLHAAKEMKRFMSIAIWVCMVICVWATAALVNPGFLFPVNTAKAIVGAMGDYYYWSRHYSGDEPRFDRLPEEYQLPQGIKDSIGNRPVDIVPWDIGILISQGLNYRGRPVIQSYSAYDGALDQLNATYYASSSGPQYVLYKSDEIDGRYGLYDETKMKLEILRRYTVIDPNWNHILLKRMEVPLISSVVESESGSVKFDERIELTKTSELQVGYLNVEYSLIGKIIRFLYQPPDLNVTLVLDDGAEFSFRCVQPNVRDGIIVNRFVPNNDPAPLALFVNSNGTLSKNVKAIQFYSSFPSGFKSTIGYRIDHHRLEGPAKDIRINEPLH